MVEAFKQAKTYAWMFLVAALWYIIATNNFKLGIKMFVMITYFIVVNKYLIKGGLVRRILWNLLYVFTGGGILFFIDMSLAAIALKIVSQTTIGKGITIVAILAKVPEACIWATVSVTFASLAGIIQIEEMDEFKHAIILKIDELRYR